jgi:NAD(P)-dependent dehydrogenase (short-subunit alcohol dehydrogenase family)
VLEDKVCVVTGGTSGLGRATAIEMGRRGARVVLSGRNDEAGADAVAEVERAGGEAHYVHCEMRDEEQIKALMATAVERFGGIDVLHNNAGVHETSLTSDTSVDTMTTEIWDAVHAINLRGPWLCTKHAAPHLRASRRNPAIVNGGSIGGLTGYPMAAAYCSTKGAIIQLTRVTAIDLAPTVRCNCYCPASVDTPLNRNYYENADDPEAVKRALTSAHLIPRMGAPEEIAHLVCFLAGDESLWTTGSIFTIDGGSLAWRGTTA